MGWVGLGPAGRSVASFTPKNTTIAASGRLAQRMWICAASSQAGKSVQLLSLYFCATGPAAARAMAESSFLVCRRSVRQLFEKTARRPGGSFLDLRWTSEDPPRLCLRLHLSLRAASSIQESLLTGSRHEEEGKHASTPARIPPMKCCPSTQQMPPQPSVRCRSHPVARSLH
jgi:hypothetical protein